MNDQTIVNLKGDLDTPEIHFRGGRVEVDLVMHQSQLPERQGRIDQLSFTFQDNWSKQLRLMLHYLITGKRRHLFAYGPWVTDDQVITEPVNALLHWVFGFGVQRQRLNGLNFYKSAWELEEFAGHVCIGGQRNTILVQITGAGILRAREGWQERLLKIAKRLDGFRLTRVDVSYDDFNAEQYSVDKALADYQAGEFTSRGRPPTVEQRGNWIRPDGRGRTLYVGRRENGKVCRVYEKGRQLGDPASEWVRIEVEWHNKDRVIPLDIIRQPGAYLAGAYSAFSFCDVKQCTVTIAKNALRITYDALMGHLQRSYGRLFSVVATVESDLESLVRSLADPQNRAPVRMLPFVISTCG